MLYQPVTMMPLDNTSDRGAGLPGRSCLPVPNISLVGVGLPSYPTRTLRDVSLRLGSSMEAEVGLSSQKIIDTSPLEQGPVLVVTTGSDLGYFINTLFQLPVESNLPPLTQKPTFTPNVTPELAEDAYNEHSSTERPSTIDPNG